jgi:hypothetical protein
VKSIAGHAGPELVEIIKSLRQTFDGRLEEQIV